jgi:hypothetical protein
VGLFTELTVFGVNSTEASLSNQEAKNEKDNTAKDLVPHFKRSKTLIIPQLQLSLVMGALLIFIAAAVIFFATANIVFMKIEELAFTAGLDKNQIFMTDLKSLENTTAIIYGITVLTGITIIFLGGLRLSHRVAGPIYVLNRQIESFCRGELPTDLKFRKGDFLIDIQDNFNKLMIRYRDLLNK